jgi:hypothetical protein
MSLSGTTDFNLDLAEILDEAAERCGMEGVRSGYQYKTARRSLSLLLLDFANKGINLWTVQEGSIPLVAGTTTYDLPADTVDLIEHVIRTGSGTTQSDLSISRISVSTYATIPSKTNTGRPVQCYINRQSPIPTITLWPVPDSSTPYTLVYWRLRRLQDAGTGATNQDVPFRFLPALIAGTAYHMAMKTPEGLARLPMLKAQYDETLADAMAEDRDKSSVRFVPRVGRIS